MKGYLIIVVILLTLFTTLTFARGIELDMNGVVPYGSSYTRFNEEPGIEHMVFFTCANDECTKLTFVDEKEAKFTINVSDMPMYKEIFLETVEREAKAEYSKGVYYDTGNVDVPENAFGVTIIQAVIDTIQSPYHLATKQSRSNNLRNELSSMLEGILDPNLSEETEHYDCRYRELLNWSVTTLFVRTAKLLKREGFKVDVYYIR